MAVASMQKEETSLLPVWLDYYGRLIGHEGIHLIDNGSESQAMKDQLSEAAAAGVNVTVTPGREAFDKKGEIIQELARSLAGKFDVIIPIDGDEFITLKDSPTRLLDIDLFYEEIANFLASGRDVGFISSQFLNLTNTDYVVRRGFRKVFVKPDTQFPLNRGYHYVEKYLDLGYMSQFSYIHFHHKLDIENMKSVAAHKIGEDRLEMFLTSDDPEGLRAKGRHMAKYLNMSQVDYEAYMEGLNGRRLNISAVFSELKHRVPFT